MIATSVPAPGCSRARRRHDERRRAVGARPVRAAARDHDQRGARAHLPLPGHRPDAWRWAAKDVFNPGAVVHDGRVHLLVRGEDGEGRYAGVSRIGLAISDDGLSFALEPEPVIFPGRRRVAGLGVARRLRGPAGGRVTRRRLCLHLHRVRRQERRPVRRHLGRPAPLGQARPGVRRFAVREADVEERIDRDRGRRRAPRRGTTRRPLLDVLGRGDLLRRHVHRSHPLGAGRLRRHRRPLPDVRSGEQRLGPGTGRRPDGSCDRCCSRAAAGSTRCSSSRDLRRSSRPTAPCCSTTARITARTATPRFPPSPTSPARRCSTPPIPPPASPAPPSRSFDRSTTTSSTARSTTCASLKGLVLFRDHWYLYYGMADSRIGCAVASAG